MKENAKFLKCPICDNIIEIIDGDVQHITCCGRKMEEMKANTTDAATEKHIPDNYLEFAVKSNFKYVDYK